MYEFSDFMKIRLWMVFQLRSIFCIGRWFPVNIHVVLVSVAYSNSIGSLSYSIMSIMSNIYAIMLDRANAIISLVSTYDFCTHIQ